jgi:hypothetical protein
MGQVKEKSLLFQMIPPGDHLRWFWSFESESWVCGEPNNGAGVFYESGENSECSVGFYFGLVVEGDIKNIASGPYASRDEAMSAAGTRFAQLKGEIR